MTFPSWPTRTRGQRGAVLPSPVVLLSIVAVALAAVAFLVTRGNGPAEREITPVAHAASSSAAPSADASADPESTESAEPKKKHKPVVHREDVGVVVFNNTTITGLAASVGAKVQQIGWKFITADDWHGTVPATTVYYPQGMQPAARKLALDLGIQRIHPADVDSDMSTTNLTVILTGELE